MSGFNGPSGGFGGTGDGFGGAPSEDEMKRVSIPLYATVASSITTGGGGSGYTTAAAYQLTEALPITGVRFYWKLASESVPETVKLCLWDNSGTLLKTVSVSVTASGVQEALFSSSYSMPALTTFKVSSYNSTRYVYFTTSTLTNPIGLLAASSGSYSLYLGGYLIYVGGYASATAVDGNPGVSYAPNTQMFGIEPITSPER
jgi:hypothetical protein